MASDPRQPGPNTRISNWRRSAKQIICWIKQTTFHAHIDGVRKFIADDIFFAQVEPFETGFMVISQNVLDDSVFRVHL